MEGKEAPMALKQEQVLIRNGYDIGIGVASATGSPMALGATGAVTPPQIGTGGSGSFTFRRIDLNDELETELGIGADVSAGIGLFSGSASFDFSKKCRIQSSSLCVLVSAEERFAFQQMDSPELSPAAAQLVSEGNAEARLKISNTLSGASARVEAFIIFSMAWLSHCLHICVLSSVIL